MRSYAALTTGSRAVRVCAQVYWLDVVKKADTDVSIDLVSDAVGSRVDRVFSRLTAQQQKDSVDHRL